MISFVRYRYVAALFSLFIVASFGVLAFYNFKNRGTVFSYSVDFTGGSQILLKFDKTIDALEVKNALIAAGFDGVDTRNFTQTFEGVVAPNMSSNEVLVRVRDFSSDAQGIATRVQDAVVQKMPGYNVAVLQNESVGPGIGSELRWKSLRAILVSLIALLFYIALRFGSFPFAAGAVIALVHDALVMLAAFLVFDREISINAMGAMIAVLGYSINDTIVIFSQIRKNIAKMRGHSLAEIIDVSINQTLRRTIMTSFTTGLVVLSMFLLGGEALRDFSLALLIGIIFGTYSSIYVASPVMMLFSRKQTV